MENPAAGQVYSDIGVVSGWKCEAGGALTVRFNNGATTPLVSGSERADIRAICGDTVNGFVALRNWVLLGEGLRTALVSDNGVVFVESTFQVGTLGDEWWPGTRCDPDHPTRCGPVGFSHSVTAADTQPGYDGEGWAAPPGIGFDLVAYPLPVERQPATFRGMCAAMPRTLRCA